VNMPTDAQVSAALRHVYTSAGTVLAIGAIVAVVPQEQVQPIMDALRQVGDGMQQVFGGVSKLVVIVGPIVAAWMAKIAATSASFKSQLRSVTATASAPANVTEKVALATATANVPGIVQVAAAPVIANATPDPKVVPVQTP
jgi:hypothetical protein